jgi:hypothetical protein
VAIYGRQTQWLCACEPHRICSAPQRGSALHIRRVLVCLWCTCINGSLTLEAGRTLLVSRSLCSIFVSWRSSAASCSLAAADRGRASRSCHL